MKMSCLWNARVINFEKNRCLRKFPRLWFVNTEAFVMCRAHFVSASLCPLKSLQNQQLEGSRFRLGEVFIVGNKPEQVRNALC